MSVSMRCGWYNNTALLNNIGIKYCILITWLEEMQNVQLNVQNYSKYRAGLQNSKFS
jgi:hypothetical protein